MRHTGFLEAFLLTVYIGVFSTGISAGASMPQLRWVTPISALNVTPQVMVDLSDSTFYCSGRIIDKRTGEVAGALLEYPIQNNSATREHGYVFADGTRIVVLSDALDTVWSKSVASVDLITAIQAGEDGYAALGGKRTAEKKLVRTDLNGTVLWSVVINSKAYYEASLAPEETGDSVEISVEGIAADESGIVIFGACLPIGAQWYDTWVIKYDMVDGSEQWRKKIPAVQPVEMITAGSGVVLTGVLDPSKLTEKNGTVPGLAKRNYFPATHTVFVSVDTSGEILVNREYSVTGYDYSEGISGNGTEMLISILSYRPPLINNTLENGTVLCVDEEGEPIWQKEYKAPAGVVSGSLPVVQARQFSSGDLAVAAFDSLYYYGEPAAVHPFKNSVINSRQADMDLAYNAAEGRIRYRISGAAEVVLSLFSPAGRCIATLDRGSRHPGTYCIPVELLSRGTYLAQLNAGGKTVCRLVRFY